MSGIYVLDVPEFKPVAEAAERIPGCIVHPAVGGYLHIQFSGSIDIRRSETGLGEAVWFGCLTGGLDGKIEAFNRDVIRLVETNEPI